MRIAEINMVDYGSTGKIMLQIADCARKHGNEAITFSKRWKNQHNSNKEHFYYGSYLENGLHVLLYRMIGFQGLFSYFGTKQLISELEKFQPDIINLHNLHDSSTCLPVLFYYIKRRNIPVVWTLHDAWPITGQCPCFTLKQCDKWKKGCQKCPQLTAYFPIDCSRFMWKQKKRWFTGIQKMIIVTPSEWLAQIVKDSFLNQYPVKVINNGIDLSVFRPDDNDVRIKLGIKKYMILGVALGWGERKGLDVFIELAKRLPDAYTFVMVGTDDNIDKILPSKIISIHRTSNQRELAELYSAADVFVNPTREDNFPTTNIEALACGTPVITYRTGGSPEMLNELCGRVVRYNDIDELEKKIIEVCEKEKISKEVCVQQAQKYDKNNKFQEYINLYNSILAEEKKN